MLTVPLQINGKAVTTTKTFDVYNPSSGEIIHKACSASISDAHAAVSAAQAVFSSWADTPPAVKRDIFLKAASILESRSVEVGQWAEEEIGYASDWSEFNVATAVNGLRDVAGRIGGIEGVVPMLQDPNTTGMVVKEPYGVILAIAPWYVVLLLNITKTSFTKISGTRYLFLGFALAAMPLRPVIQSY